MAAMSSGTIAVRQFTMLLIWGMPGKSDLCYVPIYLTVSEIEIMLPKTF